MTLAALDEYDDEELDKYKNMVVDILEKYEGLKGYLWLLSSKVCKQHSTLNAII